MSAAVIADLLQVCPQCQHEFRIPMRLAGRRLPCPHCRRMLDVAAPAAPSEDRLVGKVLGGCRLLRRLGAGALGVVYEAEHQAMGRRVAMKMLSSKAAADRELVARFQREARIAAQIRHPHVVAVHDCGHDRGVHYLTMEFVDGTTLAGLIEERGPLPWQEAARVVLQVARALDHLGTINIVHRDIKPANILVSGEGAKLADLGLAKQMDASAEAGLTMQNVAMGSPAYMAPEQVRNARDAGHAADIYSLGATLYHALAGVPPFEGRNGPEVMMKVLREEPRRLSDLVPSVPAGLVALIHRMLAKDVDERPQDAGEFVADLEAVLAAPQQVRQRRARPARPGTRRAAGTGGRGTRLVVAAAILVVAVIAIVIYWVS